MSLINEALKRAQEDKQRQSESSSSSTPTSCPSPSGRGEAIQGATAPFSEPAKGAASSFSRDTERPQGAKGSASPIAASQRVESDYDDSCKVTTVAVIKPPPPAELIEHSAGRAVFGFSAGVLVMVVLCLGMLWLREQRVREVSASETPQAQPAEVGELPTGSTELALGLIEQQLDVPPPVAGAGQPAVAAVATLPPATVQPAAPAVSAGPAQPAAPQLPAVPTVAPPLPVQPAGVPASQPDHVSSRFSLGGIMSIGDEWMATINGKLLRVGETIDGGTLIRIMSQAVEMESAGQRFTLRM